MAKGNTNSGAGGSNKSTIIVTAPTGSTVYIQSQDGKRKDAGEKNGVWTFKGCDIGTWMVHASLGDQSETVAVEITEEGQLMRYYLTLAYFQATISATWPAGSSCTCSKGNIVLTAPDTSGSYTFIVPETGEWLVNCNNGLSGEEYKETSKTVTVTTDGQTESLELSYKVYLYNKGDRCIDITGDWSAKAYLTSSDTSKDYMDEKAPSVSFGTASCTISMSKHATSGNFYKGIFAARNQIDFSAFRTLKINVTEKNGGVDFGVIDGIKNGFKFLASISPGESPGETSLDCSNITSAAYIALYIRASTANASMTFDEIWLER